MPVVQEDQAGSSHKCLLEGEGPLWVTPCPWQRGKWAQAPVSYCLFYLGVDPSESQEG